MLQEPVFGEISTPVEAHAEKACKVTIMGIFSTRRDVLNQVDA
jgi:hypothetical protein